MADSRRRSPESSRRRRRERRGSRERLANSSAMASRTDIPPSSSYYPNPSSQQQELQRHADMTPTQASRQYPRSRAHSSSSSGSSTSSSLLDISRRYPDQERFGSVFTTFFRAPSERRRLRRRRSSKKKQRVLYFGNSSSSSVNSDLAYGSGYIPRRRSRDFSQRQSSHHYSQSHPPASSYHAPDGTHSVAGMAAAGAAAGVAASAYGASGYHQQSATYDSAPSHYTPTPGQSQRYSYPQRPLPSEANGSSAGAAAAAAAAAGTGVGLAAEYYNASRQIHSKPTTPRKRQTDEEIMSIGRQLSDLAKAQNDDDLKSAGKTRPSGLVSAATKVSDYRNSKYGASSRGIGSSKIRVDSSDDDSEWESASDDDDDYSDESADSEMAYGTVISSAIRPTAAAAAAGAAGAAALSSARNQRSSVVDPRLFGPQNSLHGMVTPRPEDQRDRRSAAPSEAFEPKPIRRSATEPLGPMRNIYPVSTSDPDRFDYDRESFVGSQQDLPHRARPGPLPLQQPVPKSTVSPKVYETERLEDAVKESKDSRNWGGAAAAGVAAAAVGAALAKDRKDEREEEKRERDRDRDRRSERGDKRDKEREKEREREKDSKRRDGETRDKDRDRKSKRDSYSSKYDDEKDKEKSSKRSQFSALDGIPKKYRDSYAESDLSKSSRRRRGGDDRSEYGQDDRRSEVSRVSRRDSKKYDKREREERRDLANPEPEASGKDKALETSSVDPFKYQVESFSKVPTLSTGESDMPARPLTPTVVTVDREPAFDDSPPDTPRQDGRLSRKDSFEIEQRIRAESSEEKTRGVLEGGAEKAVHGTAPVAVGTMAAAVLAEAASSKGDRKEPDPVQEEADRYYREAEVARKIASEEIRSRSRTPERSVVDKWSAKDDAARAERPTIVTPPEYNDHHEDKKWAEHNADVRIDNVFSPSEADRFRTSLGDPGSPRWKTRDPDCERDRPLLNLIYPTPASSRKPTPAPEKQEKEERARDRSDKDRSGKDRDESSRSDIGPRKKRSKDEETRSSKSEVGISSRRRRTKDREDDTSKSDVGPTVVVGPSGDVQTVSTPKSVTWGENETNTFEVVSPEHRDDAELGYRERPRLDKSSQWGMAAAAYASSSAEPVTELDDVAGGSRSRDSDVGSSGSRRIYSVEDDVGAPPIPGPKPASPGPQQMPGGFADDIEFAATLAAGLQDTGFDPNIVVEDPTYRRRDSPPGSNEMNGSGYVIGEVETPKDDTKATESVGEWAEVPAKLSKKEKKRLEKLKKQQESEAAEATPPPFEEPVEPVEPAEPPIKLSKKEQRKRDKEAKARELAGEEETQFVAEPEPIEESVGQDDIWDDAWGESSSRKSKDRRSRDFGDDSSRVSVPVDSYADLKDTNPDDEWDEPKKSKKKKSKRDSQTFDSPSRSSTFDDVSSPKDSKPDDEWDESKKSKKKSKRDSGIYESPSRAASVISVDSTGKSRKHKRRSTGDGWDPPDRGRDPFEDRDVSSVVSEPRGEGDRRSSRRSYRYEDDDDAKSIASAPGSGKKKVSEKRSSGGLFSSIFKSSSSHDLKDKSQSFLDNAGTLGAGAGLVGVGAVAASGLSRLQATEALSDEKDKKESSQEIEEWSRDVSGFDPDIAARAIKPAIDPQYGDLLPLPPSEPGTPVNDANELPSLPDSRPDTPPEERSIILRDRVAHNRRRSAQETPTKSPSNTAIPIQLRLGSRSGPSSPAYFKSSPTPTAEAFPGAVESPTSARRPNRPTSWDNSREIKPLYLLETARYSSLDDPADHGELPALPPSEASSRSSPGPGSEAWESADEYAQGGYDDDADYSGQAPLRVDTSIAAFDPGEGAGSQETTPRAEVKPVFPEVSTTQGQQEHDPEPVEPMSKDRSSYLLSSAPSSDKSNKTVDNETLEQRLSELNTTPTKSRGTKNALADIDEGLTSADEHFSDAVEGPDNESPAPTRDMSVSEAVETPTAPEAPAAEEPPAEDFSMLTGKAKKKAKKAAKKKQAAGLDLAGPSEQTEEASDAKETPVEPAVEPAVEQPAEQTTETSAEPSAEPVAEVESAVTTGSPLSTEKTTPGKKGKKDKKNKKVLDKRQPQEEDIFDDPALWESADKKNLQEQEEDNGDDDFMGDSEKTKWQIAEQENDDFWGGGDDLEDGAGPVTGDKAVDDSVVPAVAAAAVAGAAVATMIGDETESSKPETDVSRDPAKEPSAEPTGEPEAPVAPQEEPETWEPTGKKGKKKKKKGKAALAWEDEPAPADKAVPKPEAALEETPADTAEVVEPTEITEPVESSQPAEKGLEAAVAEKPDTIVAEEIETPAEAPTESAADDFWSTPGLSKKDKKKKKKKGLQVDDSWGETPESAAEPPAEPAEADVSIVEPEPPAENPPAAPEVDEAEIAAEEQELADLETKKAKKGRLPKSADRARYQVLKERADQRAQEKAAAEPAPEPVPEPEVEPEAEPPAPEEPAAPEADEAEIATEEQELAALETKKAKKGRLPKAADRERYALLKERADQRVEKAAAVPEPEPEPEPSAEEAPPEPEALAPDPVKDAEPAQAEEEFAPISKKKKKKDKKKALQFDALDEPSSTPVGESADKSFNAVSDDKTADAPIVQSTPAVEEPVEVSAATTDVDNEISAWDQTLAEKEQLPEAQAVPVAEEAEKGGDGNRGLEPEVSEPLFSQYDPASSAEPTQATETFVSEKGADETATEEPTEDAWATTKSSKKKAKKNKKKQQQAMAWDAPEEPTEKTTPDESWDTQEQQHVEHEPQQRKATWESAEPQDLSPTEQPQAEFGWGRPTATSGKFSGKLWDTPKPQRLAGDLDHQEQWGDEYQEGQYDEAEVEAEGEAKADDGWDLDDDFFSKPTAASEPVSDDLGWDKPTGDTKAETEPEEDEWSALVTSKKSKKAKKKQAKLDAEANRDTLAESSEPASKDEDKQAENQSGEPPADPVQPQVEEATTTEEWGAGLSKKEKKKLKKQQQQQSMLAAADEPAAPEPEPATETPVPSTETPEVAAEPEAEFETPKKGKKNKKKKAAAMSWEDEDVADKPSTSTPADGWDAPDDKPSEETAKDPTPEAWEDRESTPQPETAADDQPAQPETAAPPAEDNEFLFPAKLSKKDKKKKKKQAAALEASAPEEPSSLEVKEPSKEDEQLQIPETESGEATETKEDLANDSQSPENTSGFVTPAESVSGQDPDTNPDDEWGGFSLKKSKKDKKKKKAKDLESEPTQEPETTPQPESESEPLDLGDTGESVTSGDTQGEPLEAGNDEWSVGSSKKDKMKKKKGQSVSFDEPDITTPAEESLGDSGEASQPPNAEIEKPEDEWSLGLSKKDKKKKKKAKSVTFDLGETPTSGDPQDEDWSVPETAEAETSGESAPIVETQEEQPSSLQEPEATSTEADAPKEAEAEAEAGVLEEPSKDVEAEAEAPAESASEDAKPIEEGEDTWAAPLSKKDKKKKKKAEAAAAAAALEAELADKPKEEPDSSVTPELSQPSDEPTPAEEPTVLEEPAAPEETADNSRELEPITEQEPKPSESAQPAEAAVDDDWSAGLSKKDKKKKKKAAAAAAAAAALDQETTAEPEAPRLLDDTAVSQETSEAVAEQEVAKEEAEPTETAPAEEPKTGAPEFSEVTEDSWSSGLSKKETKKQKKKAKAAGFDDWETTAEPASTPAPAEPEATELEASATVDDTVEPLAETEPAKEEAEAEAAASQSAELAAANTETQEAADDSWSAGLSKKEKKKQKKKAKAAAFDDWEAPVEPAPTPAEPVVTESEATEPEKSAAVDDIPVPAAEPEPVKEEGEAEVEAGQSTEPVPESAEVKETADDSWGTGLSKKEKKKLKKKAKAAGAGFDDWEAAAEPATEPASEPTSTTEPAALDPEVPKTAEDEPVVAEEKEPETSVGDSTSKDTEIAESTGEVAETPEKEDDSWGFGLSKKDKKKKKKAKAAAAALDDWGQSTETPPEPSTAEPEAAKSLVDTPATEETSEQLAPSEPEPSKEDTETPPAESTQPSTESAEADDSWGPSLSKKDKKKKKKAKAVSFDDWEAPAETPTEPDATAQSSTEPEAAQVDVETPTAEDPSEPAATSDPVQEETNTAAPDNTDLTEEATTEADDLWSAGLSKKDKKKKKKAKAAAAAFDSWEPVTEPAEAETAHPIEEASPSHAPEEPQAQAVATTIESTEPAAESTESIDDSWGTGLSKKDKKKKKKAKAAAFDDWETPAEPEASKLLDEPSAPEEKAEHAPVPEALKEETEIAVAEEPVQPVEETTQPEEKTTDPADDSWSIGLSKKDKKKKKKAMAAALDDWEPTPEPQQVEHTPQPEASTAWDEIVTEEKVEPVSDPSAAKEEEVAAAPEESTAPATEAADDSWDLGLSKKDKKKKKKAKAKALDDLEPVADPETVPETQEMRDTAEAVTQEAEEVQPAAEPEIAVQEPTEHPSVEELQQEEPQPEEQKPEEQPEDDWGKGLSKKDKKKKKKAMAKALDDWEPVAEPESVPETMELRDNTEEATKEAEPDAASGEVEEPHPITETPVEENKEDDWGQGLSKKDKKKKKKAMAKALDDWEPVAEPESVPETMELRDNTEEATKEAEPDAASGEVEEPHPITETPVEENKEDDWGQGLSKKDKKKKKKAMAKSLGDWEPVAEPEKVPDTMELRDTPAEAEVTGEAQPADEPAQGAGETKDPSPSDALVQEQPEEDWSQGLSKKDKKKKKKQAKALASWESEPEADVKDDQTVATAEETSTAPVDAAADLTDPTTEQQPLEPAEDNTTDVPIEADLAGQDKTIEDPPASEHAERESDVPKAMEGVGEETAVETPAPAPEDNDDGWGFGLSKKEKKKKKKAAKAMPMDWESPAEPVSEPVAEPTTEPDAEAVAEPVTEPLADSTAEQQIAEDSGAADKALTVESSNLEETGAPAQEEFGDSWSTGLSKKDKKKKKKAKSMGLEWEPASEPASEPAPEPTPEAGPETTVDVDQPQVATEPEEPEAPAAAEPSALVEEPTPVADDEGDDWSAGLSKKDKKKKKKDKAKAMAMDWESSPAVTQETDTADASQTQEHDAAAAPSAQEMRQEEVASGDVVQEQPRKLEESAEPAAEVKDDTGDWGLGLSKKDKKKKKKAKSLGFSDTFEETATPSEDTPKADIAEQTDSWTTEQPAGETETDVYTAEADGAASRSADVFEDAAASKVKSLDDDAKDEARDAEGEDFWQTPVTGKLSKKDKKKKKQAQLAAEQVSETPDETRDMPSEETAQPVEEESAIPAEQSLSANPIPPEEPQEVEDWLPTKKSKKDKKKAQKQAQAAAATADVEATDLASKQFDEASAPEPSEYAPTQPKETPETQMLDVQDKKESKLTDDVSESRALGTEPDTAGDDEWAVPTKKSKKAKKQKASQLLTSESQTEAPQPDQTRSFDEPTSTLETLETPEANPVAAVSSKHIEDTPMEDLATPSHSAETSESAAKTKEEAPSTGEQKSPQEAGEDDWTESFSTPKSKSKKNKSKNKGFDSSSEALEPTPAAGSDPAENVSVIDRISREVERKANQDAWADSDTLMKDSIQEERGDDHDDLPKPEQAQEQETQEDYLSMEEKDVQRSLFTSGAKGTWDTEEEGTAGGASRGLSAWPTPNSDSFSGSDEGWKESGRHGVPLHDDLEESPVIGRGEMPMSRLLAGPIGLLQRGSDTEEPVGGLLREDSQGSVLSTGFGSEFGGSRLSPARSLPAVQEDPEAEVETSRDFPPSPTPNVNRDSGFVTDSPRSSRRRSQFPIEEEKQQRDSGVHTDDRDRPTTSTTRAPETPTNKDKSKKLSRSAHGTPVLREPAAPERTPEPEKKSTPKSRTRQGPSAVVDQPEPPTRSLKSSKSRDYGDLGIGPSSASRPVASTSASGSASGLGSDLRSRSDSPANIGTGTGTGTGQQRSVSDSSHVRQGQGQAPSPGQSQPLSAGRQPKLRRSVSNISNTSLSRRHTPEPLKFRPDSPGSHNQGVRSTPTPPLRRVDKRVSGDLRALRQQTDTPPVPIANEGRVRSKDKDKDMADVYDGFGEGRIGSPRSPTRPHSMRRRQSMQVLELESRVDQLMAENRALTEARAQAEQNLNMNQRASSILTERDSEIETLKQSLQFLQKEVSRLTEVNDGLTSANAELANKDNSARYADLEVRHADVSRELDNVRGAQSTFEQSLSEKDAEIADLRSQLEEAKEKVRDMQRQILASKSGDAEFLNIQDEDYFDNRCQQLCSHVQQWVLRFSKFSDMRSCRLTSEINDEKTIDRLDNAVLDGSDVDRYLGDRVKRRDIFMSMTMNMIWELIFTRYLFGMDREQRQKLKSLEKMLTEVGPPQAVRQWRAVTLTLLSKRENFQDQKNQDTEAVVQAIFQTLCKVLPPPGNLENQIQSQLRRVLREAVDLSVEMRTQKAEYMMLPPLQPEYDSEGELAATVQFNASMMNERSGKKASSNEDLEADGAVVRVVLFPLVVKKGDDGGVGDEEIVVCPAQVIVAGDKGRRSFAPSSDAGGASLGGRSHMSVVTEHMVGSGM